MQTPDTNNILAILDNFTLTNAEDIDHYLEGLRQQLLKLLVDYDGVMITK